LTRRKESYEGRKINTGKKEELGYALFYKYNTALSADYVYCGI
jgi:hypothetical protein